MDFNKYSAFGVIRIEGNNIILYEDNNNYRTVYVSEPVKDARWAGNDLNVTLSDGKIRRYKDFNNYSTIY